MDSAVVVAFVAGLAIGAYVMSRFDLALARAARNAEPYDLFAASNALKREKAKETR